MFANNSDSFQIIILKQYFNSNHMKTKIELEQDIISITSKIHKEFPELVKYITEIP
ncbi:MAG: hypothetical protein ACJA17_001204, partial [Polaribacter sp.]